MGWPDSGWLFRAESENHLGSGGSIYSGCLGSDSPI